MREVEEVISLGRTKDKDQHLTRREEFHFSGNRITPKFHKRNHNLLDHLTIQAVIMVVALLDKLVGSFRLRRRKAYQ
tara:strand:+ start:488 stop:718 length:231 start_codon:yes stop_codon:yes gene_type:complete